MRSVLFICTGNIFRSMAAEYALKAVLGRDPRWHVGSAGTQAVPQAMHPLIRARLQEKGADVSGHVQRPLTRALLESADLPVAMGLDHREFIRRRFHREVPLFEQICFGREEPVHDVHEAIPEWSSNRRAAMAYAAWVIDHLWEAMPLFLANVEGHLDTRVHGA